MKCYVRCHHQVSYLEGHFCDRGLGRRPVLLLFFSGLEVRRQPLIDKFSKLVVSMGILSLEVDSDSTGPVL